MTPMAKKSSLAQKIVAWYGAVKKPLPWRGSTEPYANWIAEVMAQQTTLAVVVPRYRQFQKELPNLKALAECSEEQLRSLWAGLGYYARARNLKKGARFILDDRGGVWPTNYSEWLDVPGCGPYTAAVLASICLNEHSACVDGNGVRVVARLQAIGDEVWTAAGKRAVSDYLSAAIVHTPHPGDFNQGIMELGQEVCTVSKPACAACPVATHCAAYRANTVDQCPPPKPRQVKVDTHLFGLVLRDSKGRVGLIRRAGPFLAQTIGFPILLPKGAGAAVERLNPNRLLKNLNRHPNPGRRRH